MENCKGKEENTLIIALVLLLLVCLYATLSNSDVSFEYSVDPSIEPTQEFIPVKWRMRTNMDSMPLCPWKPLQQIEKMVTPRLRLSGARI